MGAADHKTGLYLFSLQRQDSLVAGKNFLTLENPSGSGKLITLGGFFVSYFATVANPAYPMRGYRCTGPSGGTLHDPSEYCLFDTAIAPSIAVVRSNNPSVSTQDGAFFNSPSGTVKDTVGGVHSVEAPPGFNPFLIRPGEAVMLRQDIGAVGHLWNLTAVWREVGF